MILQVSQRKEFLWRASTGTMREGEPQNQHGNNRIMGNPGKHTVFRIITFALEETLSRPDEIQSGNSTVARTMRCNRANFSSSLTDLPYLLQNTSRSILKLFELSWLARIWKLSEFQGFLQWIRREHYARTLLEAINPSHRCKQNNFKEKTIVVYRMERETCVGAKLMPVVFN